MLKKDNGATMSPLNYWEFNHEKNTGTFPDIFVETYFLIGIWLQGMGQKIGIDLGYRYYYCNVLYES
ncbi:hypothetical protein FC72_GL001856 [Companilactobacillus tucceti DSM 20183]|uniref:Uncharacterized protein n=1 Tax=Companilactobacillus tucceti DSM 20183 TaxID=1423811 RepID=A0A0R1JAT6_9LACO|nr:hypothetical protein [Companilactobacillus tucceti]KRK64802.1 hypothetical protein FC72_GL001856 [Companilactobacillus tucceti DSM 20183]